MPGAEFHQREMAYLAERNRELLGSLERHTRAQMSAIARALEDGIPDAQICAWGDFAEAQVLQVRMMLRDGWEPERHVARRSEA